MRRPAKEKISFEHKFEPGNKMPPPSFRPGRWTLVSGRPRPFRYALSARPTASQGLATAAAARKRKRSISGRNRPSKARSVCTSRKGTTPGWAKSGYQRGARFQDQSGPNDNIKGGPDLVDKHRIAQLAPHDLRRSCVKLCHAAGGEL